MLSQTAQCITKTYFRNISYILVIVMFAGLPAVATAGDWAGKNETRDGVVHVMNPAEGMMQPKTAALEELWRLGGDTDDEDQFFGVISAVLTDDQGQIYLLDSQLSQVKIFTASGEFVRDIGREGEGPGEFRSPIAMFFTKEGNVAVMQIAPGKIVLLTKDGEPVGEHPLPKPEGAGFIILLGGQYKAGNLVLAAAQNAFAEGRFDQTRYLVSIDGEGAEKTRYHSETRTIEMANAVLDDKKWDTFDRRWTVGFDGRVYACTSYDNYAISIWRPDGTLDRVVERAYTHRKRTEREIEIVNQLMGLFANQIPNCTVNITDFTKDIENIFVREDGNLWVLNSNGSRDYPEGTMGTFDVFDKDGHFVRQVTLQGEGNPRTDGYYFVQDRLYVVTDLLQAAISLQSGGQSFDLGDEEPEPMSVICYQIDDDVLSMR